MIVDALGRPVQTNSTIVHIARRRNALTIKPGIVREIRPDDTMIVEFYRFRDQTWYTSRISTPQFTVLLNMSVEGLKSHLEGKMVYVTEKPDNCVSVFDLASFNIGVGVPGRVEYTPINSIVYDIVSTSALIDGSARQYPRPCEDGGI